MSIIYPQIRPVLDRIKGEIGQKIDWLTKLNTPLDVSSKEDASPVTELDTFISNIFKKEMAQSFPDVSFFSEEDFEEFNFPVCILDPLDGTREFIKGSDEWVVSFGIYFSSDFLDPRNFSWIYNPNTKKEIHSEEPLKVGFVRGEILVSRTEYRDKLIPESNRVQPMGSIAWKLFNLAVGKATAVVSMRDKNIWDIAAGTHIAMLNGISVNWGEDQVIVSETLKKGPLIWLNEKSDLSIEFINELFQLKK